jgi:PleD family two-component response regulator
LERRRLLIDGTSIRYTASFGISSSEDLREGTDPMEALWRADAALLEAKRVGRNQCITWAALAS